MAENDKNNFEDVSHRELREDLAADFEADLWEDPRGPEAKDIHKHDHESSEHHTGGLSEFVGSLMDSYQKGATESLAQISKLLPTDILSNAARAAIGVPPAPQAVEKAQNSQKAEGSAKDADKADQLDESSEKNKNAQDKDGLKALSSSLDAVGTAAAFAVSPLLGLSVMTAKAEPAKAATTTGQFKDLKFSNGHVEEVTTPHGTFTKVGLDESGNPKYEVTKPGKDEPEPFNGTIAISDGKLHISNAETGQKHEFSPKPNEYSSLRTNEEGKVEHLETADVSYRYLGSSNGKDQYLVTTPNDQEGKVLNGSVRVDNGKVVVADHDSQTSQVFHEKEATPQFSYQAFHEAAASVVSNVTDQVNQGASSAWSTFKDWSEKAAQQAATRDANKSDSNSTPEKENIGNRQDTVKAAVPELQSNEAKPTEKPAAESTRQEAALNQLASPAPSKELPGNTNLAALPNTEAKLNTPEAQAALQGAQAPKTADLLTTRTADLNQPGATKLDSNRVFDTTPNQALATTNGDKQNKAAEFAPTNNTNITNVRDLPGQTMPNLRQSDTAALLPRGTTADTSARTPRTELPSNNQSTTPVKPEAVSINGTKAQESVKLEQAQNNERIQRNDSSNNRVEFRQVAAPGVDNQKSVPSAVNIINNFSTETRLRSTISDIPQNQKNGTADNQTASDKAIFAIKANDASKSIIPTEQIKSLPAADAAKLVALPGLSGKDIASISINTSTTRSDGTIPAQSKNAEAGRTQESVLKGQIDTTVRHQDALSPLAQQGKIVGGQIAQGAGLNPGRGQQDIQTGKIESTVNTIVGGRVVADIPGGRPVAPGFIAKGDGTVLGDSTQIKISGSDKRGGPEGRYMIAEVTLAMVLAAGGIRRILPTDKGSKNDSSNSGTRGDGTRKIEREFGSKTRDPLNTESLKFIASFKAGQKVSLNGSSREFAFGLKSNLQSVNLANGKRLWIAPEGKTAFTRAFAQPKKETTAFLSHETQNVSLAQMQLRPLMADAASGANIAMPAEQSAFNQFVKAQQTALDEVLAPIMNAAHDFIEMDDPYQSFLNMFADKSTGTKRRRQGNGQRGSEGSDGSGDGNNEDQDPDENNIILRRPSWLIGENETLISIAEEHFADPYIGWLIADLNKGNSKEHRMDGKRIVEFQARQLLTLPVWQDVVEFYGSMPAEARPENLVTIVTANQVDREVVDNVLGPIVARKSIGSLKKEQNSSMAASESKEPALRQ